MKRLFPAVIAAALTLMLLVTPSAHAGRSCEQRKPELHGVQRGLELAERTMQALDASGAQVLLLARAGQDLSRHHLRWSHLGLAYRDSDHAHWRVLHKLNHCGSASADLFRQGLGEFFLDDPHDYRAAVVELSPELQARLLPLLRDNAQSARLHTRAYNMVAYPWSQRYQQSNQWVIELLAQASEPAAHNRERAQAWLRLQGYQPTVLRIPALTRLGARVSAANVAFDDHPNAERFGDRIATVTADSVFQWLARAALGGPVQEVR